MVDHTLYHYALRSENEPAIVIDIGSHSIKAGLSGEDQPRIHNCPTVIGQPKDPGQMIGMD